MTEFDLRIFIALATELNYSKAADLLYITQPALSKKIVSLEDELGVILFERNTRGVKLTQKGAVFFKDAFEILEKIRETKKELALGTDINQSLSVAVENGVDYNDFCKYKIANSLKSMQTEHPSLSLQFDYVDANVMYTGINNQIYDIGLDMFVPGHEAIAKRNGWVIENLISERTLLAVPSKVAEKTSSMDELKEILNDLCLLTGGGSMMSNYNHVANKFGINSFGPTKLTLNIQELLMRISLGEGYSFLPESTLKGRVSEGITIYSMENENISSGRSYFSTIYLQSNHNPLIYEFIQKVKELYQPDL